MNLMNQSYCNLTSHFFLKAPSSYHFLWIGIFKVSMVTAMLRIIHVLFKQWIYVESSAAGFRTSYFVWCTEVDHTYYPLSVRIL